MVIEETDISYYIEDYTAAKTELLSTIDMQFKVLSFLATATAAVLVYLFQKDDNIITGLCSCLIIPGIYAFFGALWLDQVYRQRRLAAYIFNIEKNKFLPVNDKHLGGWEHSIQNAKTQRDGLNRPSRYYYYICLGLFYFVPVAVFVFANIYNEKGIYFDGFFLCPKHTLFFPALIGFIIYIVYISVSYLYIKSIRKLGQFFSDEDNLEST